MAEEELSVTDTILVLPGEGIGPEVITEAVKVLEWFIKAEELDLKLEIASYGVSCYNENGVLITADTLSRITDSTAVLFGATGGPEFDAIPAEVRSKGNLLAIRQRMSVYANLRPVVAYRELEDVSPIKNEVARDADIIVVRELNGGIYFGEPRGDSVNGGGTDQSINTLVYSVGEIERVARVAFRLARERKGIVHSVDKSNVLETYKLWRDVVSRVGANEFPEIELNHILVDNCTLQIVRDPRQFDVILADNMIGDILSDLAGALTGSLGMLPSASLNQSETTGTGRSLYEPVHGSAPDIAGRGIANPIGAILSVGLMMEYSLGKRGLNQLLKKAVSGVLGIGVRTSDIASNETDSVSTVEMGQEIISALERLHKN